MYIYHFTSACCNKLYYGAITGYIMGREGYAVVRALASHQCSPG